MGTGDSGCRTRRQFQSNCGKINVQNGPLEGATCEWVISVQQGHVINITFENFDIQDTGNFHA